MSKTRRLPCRQGDRYIFVSGCNGFFESYTTDDVSIYTEVIRGNYGVAAALSTILTITTVIALFLFFKITGKKEIHL